MLSCLWLLAAVLLPNGDCLIDDVHKKDGLYQLTDDNFDTALYDFNVLFVNFYDPANNRSKLVTHPQMVYASDMMENDDIPVAFAIMNCKEHTKVRTFYNYTNLPMLRLFRFGRSVPEEYQHARMAAEMVPWIRHKTNQISKILKTKEDLIELKEKANLNGVVVGLFHSFDSQLCRYFSLAAMKEKTLFFGMALTANKEIFYEIVNKSESNAEKIFIFKMGSDEKGGKMKLETTEMKIETDTNEIDVFDFVGMKAHPLVTTFREENAFKLFSSRIQKYAMLFTNVELRSHFESMDVFKEIAKLQGHRFRFMNVPSNATRLMKAFEVYYDQLPALYLLDMESGKTYKKYKYEGDTLGMEEILEFVEDFDKNKLVGSRLKQPDSTSEVEVVEEKMIGIDSKNKSSVDVEVENSNYDEDEDEADIEKMGSDSDDEL